MERENQHKMKHKEVKKLYIHKSEISARSYREEEIEGGPEQERESSPVFVFSPPGLQIIHTLGSWLCFCVKVLGFFCKENFFFSLWAGDAYLYQALRDACDQFFSWEEGLGPFICYFDDLVYYVLCLGKGFGCFLHDFGNKVVFLHSCCLWSL